MHDDEAGGKQDDAVGDVLHVDQVERMLMAIVSSTQLRVTNDRNFLTKSRSTNQSIVLTATDYSGIRSSILTATDYSGIRSSIPSASNHCLHWDDA